jgi:hypothetical protein
MKDAQFSRFSDAEYSRRNQAVRAAMENSDLDAILIAARAALRK